VFNRPRAPALPLLILLTTACAAHRSEAPTTDNAAVTGRDGAIIISGVALDDGSGSVLDAIEGKVPNFRIQRHSGECPQITLRGAVTFQSVVNPHIYVDGTRTTDTCILETLRARNVELVEVYPMGVTKRPGYGMHAHGLILVFMRTR